MKKLFFIFINLISYCAKWFLKYFLITSALIFTGIKGCQYYEVYSIKKNKIPKEFKIIETVYYNVPIDCNVAIFKVEPPKMDILKIHHPIFKQFYTGMDFLEIEKNNQGKKISKSILGYKSESGNAIGFGKSCIEDNLLSEEFLKDYYNPKSYIAFGGHNGGIVMIYNDTKRQLYYATAP